MKTSSNQLGITLVEVMIASVLLAVSVLAAVPLFRVTNRGYTSIEVNTALAGAAQKALNRIKPRVVENKRLFGRATGPGDDFLSRVPGISLLTGSQLPQILSTGTLSSSTSTAFNNGAVGNCLLFASAQAPRDFDNVLGLGGTLHSVRVEVYTFNLYYLAQDSGGSISGAAKRNLRWWSSVPYADYEQLLAMEATKRSSAASLLFNSGVRWAWNASAGTVITAFHELDAAGNIALRPAHQLVRASGEPLLSILRGMSSGGFRWSVSPNASGSGVSVPGAVVSHKDGPVPKFAVPSGQFPSGFEVAVVGSNTARQVFLRLVLVAEGSFPGTISNEKVVLVSARDLY